MNQLKSDHYLWIIVLINLLELKLHKTYINALICATDVLNTHFPNQLESTNYVERLKHPNCFETLNENNYLDIPQHDSLWLLPVPRMAISNASGKK